MSAESVLMRSIKTRRKRYDACDELESANTFEAPVFKSASKTNHDPSAAVRGWKGGTAE